MHEKLRNIDKGCLGDSVGWAFDFGSGHDLMVHRFKPHIRFCVTAQSLEPALDSVSPFLSAPSLLMLARSLSLSLSLSLSKINKVRSIE